MPPAEENLHHNHVVTVGLLNCTFATVLQVPSKACWILLYHVMGILQLTLHHRCRDLADLLSGTHAPLRPLLLYAYDQTIPTVLHLTRAQASTTSMTPTPLTYPRVYGLGSPPPAIVLALATSTKPS